MDVNKFPLPPPPGFQLRISHRPSHEGYFRFLCGSIWDVNNIFRISINNFQTNCSASASHCFVIQTEYEQFGNLAYCQNGNSCCCWRFWNLGMHYKFIVLMRLYRKYWWKSINGVYACQWTFIKKIILSMNAEIHARLPCVCTQIPWKVHIGVNE